MKITFFFATFENLGIAYLSAVLKNSGFSVDLVFSHKQNPTKSVLGKALFKSEEMLCDELLETNPAIIAFSSNTDTYSRDIKLARMVKAKNPDVPIIFGGIHPTSVPEYVIAEDAVDYVCVGEGEGAMLDLAIALRDNADDTNVANIWAKKNGKVYRNPVRKLIENLDTLPFPDKEMFHRNSAQHSGRSYYVLVGRGCYNKCTYCFNSLMRKLYADVSPKYLRHRSVENVMAELIEVKKKYNPTDILFIDDVFYYGKEWMKEFFAEYKKHINLPIVCNMYADFITDEIVQLYKDAAGGSCSIVIALETINYDIRKKIFKRNETNESIINAFNILRKHKVYTYTNVIMNIPTQDKTELIDTAIFFNKNKVDSVNPLSLRYYPQMEITKTAFEKGLITAEDIERINTGIDLKPEGFHKEKLNINIFIIIFIAGYLPKKVLDFFLRKLATSKNNKLFIISMVFYWIFMDTFKQLVFGKGPLKGFVFITLKSILHKNIHHIKNCPKNVRAYIRHKKRTR